MGLDSEDHEDYYIEALYIEHKYINRHGHAISGRIPHES